MVKEKNPFKSRPSLDHQWGGHECGALLGHAFLVNRSTLSKVRWTSSISQNVFYPTPPKPILSLGWFFWLTREGSKPGIHMPSSWRRCAPLPLHHCISHFSTLAHNGAKLVIVTTQEPTPIPQKGEMRKVVANYFVSRFPWKTPKQWLETTCENDITFRLVSSEFVAKVSLSMGFGPRKTCKKPMRIHPYAKIASWVFLQVMVRWKHSSESQSLLFRKTSFFWTGKRGNESEASKMKGWESSALFLVLFGGEVYIFSFHPTC